MKKIGYLNFLFIFVMTAYGDYYHEISISEADTIIRYINENPYIIHYCHGCGAAKELIRVDSLVKGEDRAYNRTSISISGKIIGYYWKDPEIDFFRWYVILQDEYFGSLSYNYHFVLHKELKWAVPLLKIFKNNMYGDEDVEAFTMDYPDVAYLKTSDLDSTVDLQYERWWRKNFNKNGVPSQVIEEVETEEAVIEKAEPKLENDAKKYLGHTDNISFTSNWNTIVSLILLILNIVLLFVIFKIKTGSNKSRPHVPN